MRPRVFERVDLFAINLFQRMRARCLKSGRPIRVNGCSKFNPPRARARSPITAGTFLVGAFQVASQIFDRLDAEVLISTEDQDNFVKNMITVRAEERLAFAVKQPQAFVTGSFGTIPVP